MVIRHLRPLGTLNVTISALQNDTNSGEEGEGRRMLPNIITVPLSQVDCLPFFQNVVNCELIFLYHLISSTSVHCFLSVVKKKIFF